MKEVENHCGKRRGCLNESCMHYMTLKFCPHMRKSVFTTLMLIEFIRNMGSREFKTAQSQGHPAHKQNIVDN